VLPKNVLYNIIGIGEQVAFSGGGGGAGCCKATVDGTLIALSRPIALSPGLVNGQLIGGRDISIVSGASVRCPPGCQPVTQHNVITINAEVSAQQDDIPEAFCIHDRSGERIRVSTSCDAIVECIR